LSGFTESPWCSGGLFEEHKSGGMIEGAGRMSFASIGLCFLPGFVTVSSSASSDALIRKHFH
jgi:hypothetical protein